jgi:hypothetical protein
VVAFEAQPSAEAVWAAAVEAQPSAEAVWAAAVEAQPSADAVSAAAVSAEALLPQSPPAMARPAVAMTRVAARARTLNLLMVENLMVQGSGMDLEPL